MDKEFQLKQKVCPCTKLRQAGTGSKKFYRSKSDTCITPRSAPKKQARMRLLCISEQFGAEFVVAFRRPDRTKPWSKMSHSCTAVMHAHQPPGFTVELGKISCNAAETSGKTFRIALSPGKRWTFHFYPHSLLITLWTKVENWRFPSGDCQYFEQPARQAKNLFSYKSITCSTIKFTASLQAVARKFLKFCE